MSPQSHMRIECRRVVEENLIGSAGDDSLAGDDAADETVDGELMPESTEASDMLDAEAA